MIALLLALAAQAPMVLLIEQPTYVYLPGGDRIEIPANAEIDVCVSTTACPLGPATLCYVLDASLVRVPEPCGLRPAIFKDGFES